MIIAKLQIIKGKTDHSSAFPLPPSSGIVVDYLSLSLQYRENQVYLAMVRRVLDTPGFYYSNSYDLTHSLQRRAQRAEHTPNFSQLSLYERADERFAWNAHAMKDLAAQAELRRFMVPLVHGYVVIRTSSINGKSFTFCLISRRSTYRAGERGRWRRQRSISAYNR